MKQVWVDTT